MSVTTYTSNGTPDDSLGAQGDMCVDYGGKFLWGPKGASSWSGTASSIVGPTGPQGASYALAGQSMFPTQIAYGNAITLSGTPTVLTLPGTTTPYTFFPIAPSAFMGLYAYTNIATNIRLWDQTAGVAIYSTTLAAGKNFVAGPFATTLYPLAPNHVYVWQAYASSGTATLTIEPYYLGPSSGPGLCVGLAPMCGYSTNTTFSTTSLTVPYFGAASGSGAGAHAPLRTAGIYSAVATYTPAAGTPATASVTAKLWYGSLSTGAAVAATSFNFAPVTATGTPQVILPPQTSDVTSLATGYFFYWMVTGTGTGTLQLQLSPLV